MITLSAVDVRFGAQVLFEDVTWRLLPGGHYGLVGANGTGKSTLLRLLAGELKPEAGTVSRPNELALGTLGQDHSRFDAECPLDVVIGGKPRLREALGEKEALLRRSGGAGDSPEDGNRLAELEAVIADTGGYTAEARAGALLSGLGLSQAQHRQPMRELSGGFRLRVLLGRSLFAEPQLLLLDEPTNHLDIDSIRWLEGHLRAFPGTFVVVAHDRHFLNAVCDHIADIDYQELRLYPGNYDAFAAAKALAVRQKDAEIARAEEKVADMQRFIERFRAKATKARQAQSRKKQVERIELPQIKRSSRRFPRFRFTQRRPSGREVLSVTGLSKGFNGRQVLDGASFSLQRGEKLAVVGPNGIGKSTLLGLISGALAPDAGEVRAGYEVQLGYFAQDHHQVLRGRTRVYDWLHSLAPAQSVGTLRSMLGGVLFSGDDVDKPVGALSGGEAARLLLAGLMLRQDNLLVLDEPTNHLDLEGREALMHALRDYEGTLVFVSHDRHFVSTVGLRVLVLSAEGVEDVHGNYEEYLARQGEDFLAREVQAPPRRAAESGGGSHGTANEYRQRKLRKREVSKAKRQVERLEQQVTGLEDELAHLNRRFASQQYFQETPWGDVQHDQKLQREKKQRLQELLAQWERAAAELERLHQAEAG